MGDVRVLPRDAPGLALKKLPRVSWPCSMLPVLLVTASLTTALITTSLAARLPASTAEGYRTSEETMLRGRSLEQGQFEETSAALQQRLDLNEAELKKVVQRVSSVLKRSFEDDVGPELDSLQQLLRLSDAELKSTVLWVPSILARNFKTELQPDLAALQSRLGMDDDEIKRLILIQPQVTLSCPLPLLSATCLALAG